jgi:hypothetical protein
MSSSIYTSNLNLKNSQSECVLGSTGGNLTVNGSLIVGPTGATGLLDLFGTPNNQGDYIYYSNNKWTVGSNKISLGSGAGLTSQNANSVAIGNMAGYTSQGFSAIAIGSIAGYTGQGNSAIAIGSPFDIESGTGYKNQGESAIAIGNSTAITNQGINAIAIGKGTGVSDQGTNSIAIGKGSAITNQGNSAIAIGNNTAITNQGESAIAIGHNAGMTGQGSNSIAIGNNAGYTSQGDNSIILNATGLNLSSSISSSFFISPIRNNILSTTGEKSTLLWNLNTGEVTYNTAKTFVIDHPLDTDKYLVHACLEGPEAGVYYRGLGCIENQEFVEISLPDYVSSFTTEPTPHITPIYNGKIRTLNSSLIKDNKFRVYGEPGEFSWIVYAKRQDIQTEPFKNIVNVKGDGPYKYI